MIIPFATVSVMLAAFATALAAPIDQTTADYSACIAAGGGAQCNTMTNTQKDAVTTFSTSSNGAQIRDDEDCGC
ncbi:hypothetical protein BJV74DRAFT_866809 [Russula compacta]|nr:hypothetical protein BJV74DRAFT_866809 [Russula compacta]